MISLRITNDAAAEDLRRDNSNVLQAQFTPFSITSAPIKRMAQSSSSTNQRDASHRSRFRGLRFSCSQFSRSLGWVALLASPMLAGCAQFAVPSGVNRLGASGSGSAGLNAPHASPHVAGPASDRYEARQFPKTEQPSAYQFSPPDGPPVPASKFKLPSTTPPPRQSAYGTAPPLNSNAYQADKPQQPGFAPQTSAPQGYTPQAYAPQTSSPQVSSPQGSNYQVSPQPYTAAPQQNYQPQYQPAPAPQMGAPQMGAPQMGAPQNGAAQPGVNYDPFGAVGGAAGLPDPYAAQPPYTAYQGPRVRDADLVINGFPARTGRIMFGGAVNSDAGVTGQVTVDERNFDITRFPTSFRDLFSGTAFRGAGQTFRIEAAPGTDFKRYTMQFVDPNLFGYQPVSMSLSGFLYDRRFNDWDEERLGGRVAFGYRITPDLSINAGVSGQSVDIDSSRTGPQSLLDVLDGDNALYSGEVSLTHDTRNSPIQASQGHYFQFKFEEVFGDFDYARFETEFRQYWLLSQRADKSGRQTLSYSTRLGFSGDETPIFENFFAGGYATMRGFDFRGAGPVAANGVETGGRFQWLNTVEYMFPITADDAFRGVAFVDFGTVEEDIEIDSDNFRVAPGLGLRVAIPMLGPAPLAFDFAVPVAKADTDQERVFSFYMSLIR